MGVDVQCGFSRRVELGAHTIASPHEMRLAHSFPSLLAIYEDALCKNDVIEMAIGNMLYMPLGDFIKIRAHRECSKRLNIYLYSK